MDSLLRKSEDLVIKAAQYAKRGIYNTIQWESKLIGIKGARGIGKTTLMLQRIHELNLPAQEALFLSLDDWYFTQHTLIETAEQFIKKGGKYLFLDEVHKYAHWAKQIKNLYDFYDIRIVFTGSSILDIAKEEGDLSRRAIMYYMQGLSFREFLNIEYKFEFQTLILHEIIDMGSDYFRNRFPTNFQPYKYFDEYLKYGYYPLYKEGKNVYFTKIQQVIRQVIEYDMAELKGFDIRNAKKMLQLLGVISQNVPFKPNIQKLSEKMDFNRVTLYNYIVFLSEAKLINLLFPTGISISTLQKPEKIFFENTNLAFALASQQLPNTGTLRETFVLNQLKPLHEVNSTTEGDFIVDNKWLIEIGGKNKTMQQIKHIENSYRVLDDYEFTKSKDIIPLWMIGFLY